MSDTIAKNGVVASCDPLAAASAAEILRMGGNAVDAAVCDALVECVVQPNNVGIGGYAGAMAIYLAKERRVVSINFDSVAPLASTPNMYEIDPEGKAGEVGLAPVMNGAIGLGYLSLSVPSIVAGLSMALKRYGSMSWADVSRKAIYFAEHGYPISSGLANVIQRFLKRADDGSKRALFPDGKVPGEGELFVQRDLANLLKKLADEGPEAFYGPEIADKIVQQVSNHGGILQMEDFTRYSPVESESISVDLGAYRLHTPELPAGGLTSLQIAKAIHEYRVDIDDLRSGRYQHALIEISKQAWRDRLEFAGDPLFVDDHTDFLLSNTRIREMLLMVEDQVPADEPIGALSTDSHTVHITSADRERNMVALTATHGGDFGSHVVIDGLGLVLAHGMCRFDPVPGRANSIAPGKRMLHNMSPMILLKDGEINCAFGLPGGRKIVNTSAQMAICFTQFGMTPSEAIHAPRVHTESLEPTLIENTISNNVVELLESRGHTIELLPSRLGGTASAVMVDTEGGYLRVASQNGSSHVAVQ